MAIVAATNWPATPASGSTVAASRAAPQPARNSPITSSALTTTPPSISPEVNATKKSCGTARGAASDNPSAASERYDRGVDTASRIIR